MNQMASANAMRRDSMMTWRYLGLVRLEYLGRQEEDAYLAEL